MPQDLIYSSSRMLHIKFHVNRKARARARGEIYSDNASAICSQQELVQFTWIPLGLIASNIPHYLPLHLNILMPAAVSSFEASYAVTGPAVFTMGAM
ncbi:hypothetical protein BaRGS_00017188 [Batillaria attramentaria]|uniref:Uncharacterized protein n=1 Tax=Batillaria attramentaria TaxID=370345 RepID=A0ABD0KWE3_9CAEN